MELLPVQEARSKSEKEKQDLIHEVAYLTETKQNLIKEITNSEDAFRKSRAEMSVTFEREKNNLQEEIRTLRAQIVSERERLRVLMSPIDSMEAEAKAMLADAKKKSEEAEETLSRVRLMREQADRDRERIQLENDILAGKKDEIIKMQGELTELIVSHERKTREARAEQDRITAECAQTRVEVDEYVKFQTLQIEQRRAIVEERETAHDQARLAFEEKTARSREEILKLHEESIAQIQAKEEELHTKTLTAKAELESYGRMLEAKASSNTMKEQELAKREAIINARTAQLRKVATPNQ